jgi:iron(III) transport system permease protein
MKKCSLAVFLFLLLFFAAFFLWPMCQVLRGGFVGPDGQVTLSYFAAIFRDSIYMESIRNSILTAAVTTSIAFLIALPLAYFSDRYEFPGKKIFTNIVLLPIMLPPFVGAIGVHHIFGVRGMMNALLIKLGVIDSAHLIDWMGDYKLVGMCLLNAISLYPILYLNLVATLANIDPSFEEAAECAGCHGMGRFFKITFPLMRPGIFAGVTLVFIWSFTELGVPLIFDYSRVVSVQIYSGLKEINDNQLPFALVGLVLLLSLIFYVSGKLLTGGQDYAMVAKASHVSSARRVGVLKKICCCALFGGVTFVALMPHVAVILTSFAGDWYNSIVPNVWTLDNYKTSLSHPLTIPSIQNSIVYSGLATFIATLFGIAIAFVVVRSKLKLRWMLDSMTMLPLAVPGLVIAFGYLAMSQKGRIFSFLNPGTNPTVLLVIAYAIRKLPFIVRSAVSGLQQMSYTYEEAAQCLGCTPIKAAVKITLPLIISNLMAGALLVFSQTMLEVSDSLVLAQKQHHYPITKAIYELMNLLGDGPFLACSLGVWAMTFLAVTIIGMSIFMGKNLGAIFRA